jgi:putative sigma-54 modulation protein
MNVDIQSPGFPVTAALADHTGRRLRFVLTHHSDRIQRVVVRLGDANGRRSGVDKFCRIQVYLSDAPVAAIEEIGPDLYAVINRAADRVGRLVVKHLDRSRIGRRHGHGNAVMALPDKFYAAPTPTNFEGEWA